MKVKNQYPEWVEKYRTKGCTIRKVRNGYGLYRCTSVSDPNLPYPKSKQEYLGMVTEKDGFIPKKATADHPLYIEFGLSHLIWGNFKRELLRSSFNGTEDLIRLGIVKYLFSDVNEALIRLSFISDGKEDAMIKVMGSTSGQRVENIRKKIDSLLIQRVNNETDRSSLEAMLRCCVMDSKNRTAQVPALPDAARQIIERYGLKYAED